MLRTTDEYMAACMTEARRTLDFFGVMESFQSLSKLPFSEHDQRKLLQSLEDAMKRLQVGKPLARYSEKKKPTAEQIAATREFLKAIRQAGESAEESVKKYLGIGGLPAPEIRLLLSEEAVEEIAKEYCTRRLMEFIEGAAAVGAQKYPICSRRRSRRGDNGNGSG